MLITSGVALARCRICNTPGHVCGDNHLRGRAPIDLAPSKEDTMALEMREYEYMVGDIPTTAMLTEKMAQRLNAKPVGEHSGKPEHRKTAERMSTQTRQSEDEGVDATYPDGTSNTDAATKARTARNKRGN